MTDREMLLICYGAMKSNVEADSELKSIIELLYTKLFYPERPPTGGLIDATDC